MAGLDGDESPATRSASFPARQQLGLDYCAIICGFHHAGYEL